MKTVELQPIEILATMPVELKDSDGIAMIIRHNPKQSWESKFVVLTEENAKRLLSDLQTVLGRN